MNGKKVREINKVVRQMFPEIQDEQLLKIIARKAKKLYLRRYKYGYRPVDEKV